MRRMVRKHRVDLLLLQESKVRKDVERTIFSVWGSRWCCWGWMQLVGASGGLISIWREDSLKKVDVLKIS